MSGNPEGETWTTTTMTTTTRTRRSATATATVRFVMLLLLATTAAAAAAAATTTMVIVAIENLGTTTFQTSMAVMNDAWPYLYDSSTDPSSLSSSTTTAVCHPGTEAWECDGGIVHCLPCFVEGLADLLHEVCVRGPTLTPAGGDDPCAAPWSTRTDRYYVDEEGMGAHT